MTPRWPLPIRILHWATALLVLTTVPAIYAAMALAETDTDLAENLAGLHILCGLAILALTLSRLALRLALPAPPGADQHPALRAAAGLVTGILYGLLVALPITGILKLTSSGLDVSAFGFVLIPSFGRAPALAKALNTAHEWLGKALIALALAHAAMAILHRRLTGTAILRRMA